MHQQPKSEWVQFHWTDPYVQIVLGGLLGDGSLESRQNARTPMYFETHGLKQRDYLLWKCKMLVAKSCEFCNFDKRTGKFYAKATFWISDPRNIVIYSHFYSDGKKSIQRDVLESLTPLALLIFWLDDGSIKLHDGNGRISTQGFSRDENIAIVDFLRRRHGVEAKVSTQNEIFMSSKELPKFLGIIYPLFEKYHVPDCMRYKMGSFDSRNAELIENYKEKRRKHDRQSWFRRMSDPAYRARVNELRMIAQKRRLSDPEYRRKYNEYARIFEREKRAREWLKKNGGNE